MAVGVSAGLTVVGAAALFLLARRTKLQVQMKAAEHEAKQKRRSARRAACEQRRTQAGIEVPSHTAS